MQRLYEVFGQDEDPTQRYALILMDEIDAHMHPLWQRTLISHLMDEFPNAQFIASTHSPLVVGGLPAEQVVRFARDKEGKAVTLPMAPDVTFGYTDQILTSDLFNLSTTLGAPTEKKMKRYYALDEMENRDEHQEEHERLRQELMARVPPRTGNYEEKHKEMLSKALLLKDAGRNYVNCRPREVMSFWRGLIICFQALERMKKMIRVDFNPDNIPGSLLLAENDLKGISILAVKLRDAEDVISQHLLGQFSPQIQQLLANYQSAGQMSEALRRALVDGLNQQLKGPCIFDRQRFKGTVLERDTLIKALIKQPLQGEDLLRLNRLLLEDAYAAHITKSPRAEWEGWVSLARDATESVIKQWEDWKANPGNPPAEFVPQWEDYVWKGIRDWLLKYVFYNKCAYCETTEVGYISDAEHFRPKGQVRNKSGIVKTFDVDGVSEITHPGYFWLAYHWQNLLPSCNTCNRYGGKGCLSGWKCAYCGKAHNGSKRDFPTNEQAQEEPVGQRHFFP